MKSQTNTNPQAFRKQYTVAIDTVPLPERPAARVQLVVNQIAPVINEIVTDAITVAIGSWPSPQKSTKNQG